MQFTFDVVHILIYVTIAFWLFSALPLGKWKRRYFFLGGLVMVAAFVFRWIDTSHAPLRSMFDVFLALGVVVAPLWWFCERFLGARMISHTAAAMVGVCVLLPAGLVFDAQPQTLPPALQSPLFVPHVAAYMLAYMILFLAGMTAARQLLAGRSDRAGPLEQLSHRMVCLGFPLLTLGLVLGAVWGKLCWGDYWNWDPKELWSLATWLAFTAYLHWRRWQGGRFAKTNAALVLAGVACVILTLLWVNVSRLFPGMHRYAG
ncbi:MAG: cytochrome c biogenesis protein CcsA [Phycisphaerae bacterium]|nr:cytochrome c biogenesis protein CcsA [Phycisphaerae bacterium]